jgi:signal peptidase II
MTGMSRPTAAPLRSLAALARFVLTAGVGLAADLYTKSLAAKSLANGEVVVAVPGWLRFEYVQNRGAVFGIAQGQRWAFLIVSALAVAFLVYLFANSGRRRAYQVVLGMLLAGVLGNLYDRVMSGYVRDMIHALPEWRWPAAVHRTLHLPVEVFPYIFNVADTLLCVGVGILLVGSFFAPPEPARPAAAVAADPA